MGRKVFISFLGMGNYKECVYVLNSNESSVVTYVQEAIIQLACSNFKPDDIALFCLTNEAKKKHKEVLAEQLAKYKNIKPIWLDDIKEGFTESEIWDIFQVIFEKLNEGDELYLDITHGFRSLPMLAMVLLNYAKILKKTIVGGIYYGAFEKLGPAYTIDERIPNPIDRKSPLLDLTAFAELQDWTNAVSSFVKFGNAKAIKELAQKEVLPILKIDGDENTVIARELFYLAQSIDRVTDALNTNRGTELIEGKLFQTLVSNLSNLSNQNFIPAFQPIIDLIRKKTDAFAVSFNVMNGFTSVQWAIDHDQIQQGYTMLQESIITYYCNNLGLDPTINKDREKVTSIFYALKILMTEKIDVDYNHPINLEIASIYESLTLDRNDINHGGFSKSKKPENLRKDLKSKFEQVKRIINN